MWLGNFIKILLIISEDQKQELDLHIKLMLHGQFCGSFNTYIYLMEETCHLKEITNRNVRALFLCCIGFQDVGLKLVNLHVYCFTCGKVFEKMKM